jgi:hypothetical protein
MFYSSFVDNTYLMNEKASQLLGNLVCPRISVLSSKCRRADFIRILACFPVLAPTIINTAIAIRRQDTKPGVV